MFARAARFPAPKDDGLPGPGAFDPRSPESKKKGAFLEKEERFKAGKHDGIGADWFFLPYALSCSDPGVFLSSCCSSGNVTVKPR